MTAKACRGIIPSTTCEAQMRFLIFNSDDCMVAALNPHNHILRQPLLREPVDRGLGHHLDLCRIRAVVGIGLSRLQARLCFRAAVPYRPATSDAANSFKPCAARRTSSIARASLEQIKCGLLETLAAGSLYLTDRRPCPGGEELARARAAPGLVEPQFLHLIRLGGESAVNGLTSRADAPFLTVGSLVSTHPEIQGRIDDATLGIGFFDGPGGARAAILAGCGLYRA